MKISRRSFLKAAAAMGASLAWVGPARGSRVRWHERRDLYPQGVASGDPDPHSVILWTRRPFADGTRQRLTVEVAEDEEFRRVIAHASAPVFRAADWTARVLIGGLKPARTYWYRFTDSDGNGSRVGRTITAPLPNDPRTVNFAFVSCQDVNEGKLNAYRRMLYEDERAPAAEQLDFVLHLGDFIYEVVEYPDEVKTRYDRTIYEVARIPDGHKVGNFHIPLTVDGYRAIYKGYLADPDLQDARARWPFVAMWDNHEFSWQGWQSIVKAGPFEQPGQSVKVAANQAWFEYLPARVAQRNGSPTSIDRFDPPAVTNAPIKEFDGNGLGLEPNNLTAINSLKAYRALRYGQHLDLIITDQHSYRSADPFSDPSLEKLGGDEFTGMFPEPAMQALDGGRGFNGGNPPPDIRFNDAHVENPQRSAPPQTILGAEQKAWFKTKLESSTATWKIWGNSLGALDSARRPAEPAPWAHQGALAGEHVRFPRRGGLRDSVCGARRDLPCRARREDHGLRHRVGRPPQLLGGIRDRGASARKVRAGRLELRRRVTHKPRRHGSLRAQPSEKRPAAIAVSRRQGQRRDAGLDLQHAAETRRPFVSRICKELRPEARSLAVQPGCGSAPRVRRSGRTRLCEGPIVGR